MSSEFDADTVSSPRLVQMVRGADGYGFNLHGERNIQAGQTISAVDDGGVAQKAGLRVGDKVVEVNGVNVELISHGDVVKKIKMNEKEVTMLVVDQTTAAYLKQEGRPITADMANLMTVYVPKVSVKEVETVEEAPPAISVESAVMEEESAPPLNIDDEGAAQVDSGEAEVATDLTTPEEVKQLNEVLDNEQEKEEEDAISPPAPEPEPAPVLNNGSITSTPSSEDATTPPFIPPASGPQKLPTTKPLRSTIKQQKQESWDQKYKRFQQL